MTVTLLNPGTTPVTYTDDARVIAAGQRITGVTLDHTGQTAVDHGYLVAIEEDTTGQSATAQPADQSAPEVADSTASAQA